MKSRKKNPRRFALLLGLIPLALAPFPLASQDPSAAPPTPPPPLRHLHGTVFQIGQVQFDKTKRELQFPAAVQMNEGVVEYLLVHQSGKLHESVLRTDAEPFHIHLASLLIAPTNSPGSLLLPSPSAHPTNGAPVSIRLQWQNAGKNVEAPAEDFIFNLESKTPMTHGDWIYNGSRVINGGFLAQRDGSIASVISDPDALMNNPRPGRENDDIWEANARLVPKPGTPVQVLISFKSKQDNHP